MTSNMKTTSKLKMLFFKADTLIIILEIYYLLLAVEEEQFRGPELGDTKANCTLKSKFSLKRVIFSCTCQRIFFLCQLKAYSYGFILSYGSKFLGAPFMD